MSIFRCHNPIKFCGSCTLVAVFTASIAAAAFAYSQWESVGEKDKVWQLSNLSMKNVSAEFNHYHHFVGTTRASLHITGDKYAHDGSSLYIPLNVGPYGDKTVIEVQFDRNSNQTIERFRFVERKGSKFAAAAYSDWQTKNFGSPYNIENSDDATDHLTFYSNEIFDRKTWTKDFMRRSRQVWHFLHTTPIIGMTRNQVLTILGSESAPHSTLPSIGYYQLQPRSDNVSAPKLYLELKYENDRVVAFKCERIAEIETVK